MQPTALSDIRGKHTKLVESPATGYVYRIRRVSQLEQQGSGLSAVFTVDADTQARGDVKGEVQADRMFSMIGRILEIGVLEPRLFAGPFEDTPEDRVHISDVSPDEFWLYNELMEFTGVTPEARQEVEDFAKNAPGSESSTKSPEPTGDSPTKSLSSGPERSA